MYSLRNLVAVDIALMCADQTDGYRGTANVRRYLAYSNGGAALSVSFVAPAKTSLLSTSFNCDTRMATSCFVKFRKPPALMMAKDTALSGATMMSSTEPMRSFLSLYTGCPRIVRFTLQPLATVCSSETLTPTVVDPASCGCAVTGAVRTILASISMRIDFMLSSIGMPRAESFLAGVSYQA